MSSFKAILPLKVNTELSEFRDIAKEWIQGSQYINVSCHELDFLNDLKVKNNNEVLEVINSSGDEGNHFGLQYVKFEEDCEWRTEIVAYKTASSFNTSIVVQRLDYSVGKIYNTPIRPYLIKLLMEKGKVMKDDNVKIEMYPKQVNKNNYNKLVNIINGCGNNTLPIVYISKPFFNEKNVVNPSELAKKLSGFAHVFYDADSKYTDLIKNETDMKNPYNGTVAVYWPGKNGGSNRYNPYKSTRSEFEHIKILGKLIQSKLSSRKIDEELQWNSLTRMKTKKRIKGFEEKTKTYEEMEAFMSEFINENDKLNNEIEELKRRNDILENRVTELEWHISSQDEGIELDGDKAILGKGNEQELYTHEQYVIVRESLISRVKDKNTSPRIKDIISSILSCNPECNTKEEYHKEVKSILKKGKLKGRDKKELKRLGIDITEDGKHFKLRPLADGRYSMSIAKTPSDKKAGNNNVKTFKNTFL